MDRRTWMFFATMALIALPLTGEPWSGSLEASAGPVLAYPQGEAQDLYSFSYGARATFTLKDWLAVRPLAEVQDLEVQVQDGTTLGLRSVGFGGEWLTRFDTHFGASVALKTGLYQGVRGNLTASSWWEGGQAALVYRLTPDLSLAAEVGYGRFEAGPRPLMEGVQAALTVRFGFSGGPGSVKASVEGVDPVFPVLHTWYGENSYARVKVTNLEDGTVEDLQVGLFLPQYMEQTQFSVPHPALGKGADLVVPVRSLFNDAVFRLSEDTKVGGDLVVRYRFLGEPRERHFPVTVPLLNRNALSWDDDRKAAAFVGPKDPAVLRFTKYAAGLVRDAGSQGLTAELAFGVGLFEGFRALGIRYVVDPTTPYGEFSADQSSVDYLQFPFQTILYKGGDCDDLSILYCSMLESIGIPAAFITVPGHIYAAFDLNLTETQAQATFMSTQDLIFIGGRTWLPVEVTLTGQGFLKAWQTGAREWREAGAEAKLIPIRTAWASFPPVGIPGEEGRFVLPDSGTLMAPWGQSMAEITQREFDPKLAQLKAELAKSTAKAAIQNRIGLLYARFGRYKEAEVEFQGALRLGSPSALVNLGKVYLLTKRPQLAKESLTRALAAHPDDPNARAGLVKALEDLGQGTEAARVKAVAR